VEAYAADPATRTQLYGALHPLSVAAALDKLREVPQQARRQPGWLTRRAAEAAAKQIRAQQQAAAASAAVSPARAVAG
jgi:hypothetical protein